MILMRSTQRLILVLFYHRPTVMDKSIGISAILSENVQFLQENCWN